MSGAIPAFAIVICLYIFISFQCRTKLKGYHDEHPAAEKEIARIEALDSSYARLPVCIAKTQYSFSDNAKLTGAPTGFKMNVREVRLSAGAGFVVVICGSIMTMPGLPKHPAAMDIDVDAEGRITGLF